MSQIFGPSGGFFYEEPVTVTPQSTTEPEKVLTINMFRYLTSMLIIGIRNEDTSDPCWIRITREAHNLGEERVLEAFIDPGETKYWVLYGMFIYNVYANRKATIIYIPVIVSQVIPT